MADGLGSRAAAVVSETAERPLALMARTTATDYWNDSCSEAELRDAIAHGAVGATSNPTIVLEVLRREGDRWIERIRELHADQPEWTEVDLTWAVVEEMAVRGAALLEPVFEREDGRTGRLSIQTNPADYANRERMLAQGLHFHTLARNVQVKFPATAAGISAIEAATGRGVSINATVSFTLAQAVAVAEAVERGLDAWEAAGGMPGGSAPAPVCTLMLGRLDDWIKASAERDDVLLTPGAADWAGVAVMKRAYELFRERGYRTRLLGAAYRNHLHWSELIGGDLILTMPHRWQERFNNSDLEVRSRIDEPVPAAVVAELCERSPDFRAAFEEDGLSIAAFDHYGATVRTLRTFIASYHELIGAVRDVVLPDPDRRQ